MNIYLKTSSHILVTNPTNKNCCSHSGATKRGHRTRRFSACRAVGEDGLPCGGLLPWGGVQLDAQRLAPQPHPSWGGFVSQPHPCWGGFVSQPHPCWGGFCLSTTPLLRWVCFSTTPLLRWVCLLITPLLGWVLSLKMVLFVTGADCPKIGQDSHFWFRLKTSRYSLTRFFVYIFSDFIYLYLVIEQNLSLFYMVFLFICMKNRGIMMENSNFWWDTYLLRFLLCWDTFLFRYIDIFQRIGIEMGLGV